MSIEQINKIKTSGLFSEIDIHFAKFISELSGGGHPSVALAAAMISSHTQNKHICLDLTMAAGKHIANQGNLPEPIICPGLPEWLAELKSSPVVGKPGDFKPLILDNKARLYLYRYHNYETKFALALERRAEETNANTNIQLLQDGLNRLFPQTDKDIINWQKAASLTAVMKKLCVITGGPGTGKTSTVVGIMSLLLEQDNTARIALTAPTGKACARMQESIIEIMQLLKCSDTIKKLLPAKTSTVHRLLGAIPNSPYFRYNEHNQLPYDAVIIDEASMVDLALMSKLVDAIPSTARLIILGDKDQLASVEAGSVFGDICGKSDSFEHSKNFYRMYENVTGDKIKITPSNKNTPAISDCLICLQKNYRFGSDSGIGIVSQYINYGDADSAIDTIENERYDDIELLGLPHPDDILAAIESAALRGYKDYLKEQEPIKALALFNRFRVLCAIRKGPYGINSLNRYIEKILTAKKLIKPDSEWYIGRPVMVAKNDYALKLFNGDIGIILPDREKNNERRAFFLDETGKLRNISPIRLPQHETVYAMTVHKSQGSEFDEVLLILPDKESPVVARELLYTAITRSKKKAVVWSPESIFRAGVSHRTKRTSGLADLLWQ
ncbi:MAG: exodeoxyribonuclease V subunit alpha [candidate division Zixibacteria bacterium]|nr:exodeoxyribonuclease V subunit alpha [candidate division Zixibacteria bacterium]